MKRFDIYNIVEYRSDDPTWIMWRVRHTDGKDYLMAYDKDGLKEVYFVGEGLPNYFMSCRAKNLRQISHYYVDDKKSEIRRYENGYLNRTVYDEHNGIMYCDTHMYVQKPITTEEIQPEKLYNDLVEFLNRFEKSGIKIKVPVYVR